MKALITIFHIFIYGMSFVFVIFINNKCVGLRLNYVILFYVFYLESPLWITCSLLNVNYSFIYYFKLPSHPIVN